MKRYISAEKEKFDDFGIPFTGAAGEVVYDAVTKQGPWAMMSETSWKMYGRNLLGVGYGQKYVRNERGELHCVEGL